MKFNSFNLFCFFDPPTHPTHHHKHYDRKGLTHTMLRKLLSFALQLFLLVADTALPRPPCARATVPPVPPPPRTPALTGGSSPLPSPLRQLSPPPPPNPPKTAGVLQNLRPLFLLHLLLLASGWRTAAARGLTASSLVPCRFEDTLAGQMQVDFGLRAHPDVPGQRSGKKNKKAKGCLRKKAFCKEDSTIFLVSCGTKVRPGPYIFLEEVYSLLKTKC